MTTIEGNKLIAEFLGWKNKGMVNLELWERFSNDTCINTAECKFNSSWDWLMPVVEKIEKTDFVVIIKQTECVIVNNSGETPMFIQEILTTKIESVWRACVEFIKWYNENK